MKEKARNRLAQDLSSLASRANQADSYRQQLDGYQSQFNAYQNQINTLTGQYNTALQQASDWEQEFSRKSAEYEAARAEADRYQEEAVGRQLAGLRGGSTVAGSGFAAQSGDATTGRTAFQDGSDDAGLRIDKGITATDPLMARKGPVVQRIRTAAQSSGNPAASLASGGSGSYYASRFG